MKKVLYVYGGGPHPTEWIGGKISGLLDAGGKFKMEMTTDFDMFASLKESGYDAVIIYTATFNDALKGKREEGLLGFVREGGGLVGLHSAAFSFRESRSYIEMLNAEYFKHPDIHEFKISIADKAHYITEGMADFSVYDEMYHLQNYDPSKATLLFKTVWEGKDIPLVFARDYGKGRLVYVANGHTKEAWENSEFQKIIVRAITYTAR
ncbi:MAG: ThuA domain-containing protein [Candidatus Omnitrophica bacterium]|nr:ThuA domain-containing protein [Candidatus Omnitrophota bacterium]